MDDLSQSKSRLSASILSDRIGKVRGKVLFQDRPVRGAGKALQRTGRGAQNLVSEPRSVFVPRRREYHKKFAFG